MTSVSHRQACIARALGVDRVSTPCLCVAVKPGAVFVLVLHAWEVHGAVREARAAPLALPHGEAHPITCSRSGCSLCSCSHDGGNSLVDIVCSVDVICKVAVICSVAVICTRPKVHFQFASFSKCI